MTATVIPMHVNKTRQDKQPVESRERVSAWSARRIAMGVHVEAKRRMDVQAPRLAEGMFSLRHLNSYLRNRSAVVA